MKFCFPLLTHLSAELGALRLLIGIADFVLAVENFKFGQLFAKGVSLKSEQRFFTFYFEAKSEPANGMRVYFRLCAQCRKTPHITDAMCMFLPYTIMAIILAMMQSA